MSLYTRMLNSTATVSIKEAAYGHEEGPVAIAMESAKELYEIFRESTYPAEQAELAAVTEGVVFEGSQFEVVKENALKTGFTKIKEFLQKLWAKVKAFFANVRKYLDGIFMSGKDFATKYEKQIKGLKLAGFEYNMYKYDHAAIDKLPDAGLGESLLKEAEKRVSVLGTAMAGSDDLDKTAKAGEKFNKTKVIEDYRKDMLGVTDEEDQTEAIFGLFRSGAKDESDKEDIKVNIFDIIKILKDSKPGNIDSVQSKTDSAYKKAIDFVDKAAKAADKEEGDVKAKTAEVLRDFSSALSSQQSIQNAIISGMKSAFTERSNTYKKVCLAAFKYKESK